MSRIGNKTITIPTGVELKITDGNEVSVKGPKGTLTRKFSTLIDIKVDNNIVSCVRSNEAKHTKQLHGTTRALLNNMIVGVSDGYSKSLLLVGIGFRASIEGNKLILNIGYSHPIEYIVKDDIKVTVSDTTKILVEGIDKQSVGEVAANIRSFRKPEPYKGKGIKYENEIIRRKEGKTAAK